MDKKYVVTFISAVLFVLPLLLVNTLQGASPVILKYDRSTIISNWQMRIESFLAKDVIPLIDLESSLKKKDGERYLKRTLTVMDRLGVALIAFDGYQAPKEYKEQKGYRWGYYIHEIVNTYPDRFILTANGGTSKNWLLQKNSFISQTEEQVAWID